ncbi:hypothetical protein B2A_10570 [mine drainage metagenome]|uniref:Antitoxin n=1 Tax=mine drainage metagenome TaxID=410659 RepID=T1ALQ6_9ZZZZ
MVKALITISEQTNRVLNIVKAEYGLKDKSQAIDKMVEDYAELVFEPRVKASYIRKLKKIRKERLINIGTIEDFDRRFHINTKK